MICDGAKSGTYTLGLVVMGAGEPVNLNNALTYGLNELEIID
jgi:hypothetical protein